jgi:hypothetical protein
MKIHPVTEAEIISIIINLKSKNSSGYDGITNKIMKLCRQQISKPLTYVINKSLIHGCISRKVKICNH